VIRRLSLGPGLNWQIIVPIVSSVLLAVGLGMAVCFAVAVVGGDGGTGAFGIPAAVILPLAVLGVASATRLRSMPLRARDGFFSVTAAWVVAAAVGAVPFLMEGTFDRAADAFFESMSGFTTTGATLIGDVEAQSDAILLWRSLSQWLGGVGIVVLVVAIAPATGLASQRVFHAELSGITADRLTPRIAETAKIIVGVYLVLTTLGFLCYWIAGMGPWDAVNHVFTTVATGGFSTRTASLAGFDSLAIELVAIVFMTAGGVNFAFYWLALRDRERLWPNAAEVRAFLLILLGATAVLTATLMLANDSIGLGGSLRASAFTAVSVITSTGYTTVDFDEWHDFGRTLLLVLMFVGGCAGSTAGGMKVIRWMLLFKTASQELQRQLQPKAIQVLRVRGRVFPEEVRRGVLGFFLVYMLALVVGALVMAAFGLDLVTAIASSIATLNIIGPGIGDIGATESYAVVPEGGRWFLSVLMLVGRLEVFTVLVLLTPAFWRPSVA
jgi:trk system potassium uptake protein TrkH